MTSPTVAVHESAMGRWTQTQWAPPSLAGVVDLIWDFEGVTGYRWERAFPNGGFELIVHQDDRCREARASGGFQTCPALCISGLQTGPTVVEFTLRPTRILGIRLSPLGAYLLTGRPVHPLTDDTVDLDDLFGAASRELADRIGAAANGPARVRQAAAWVAARIARSPEPDPAVRWVARSLEASHGATRIDALRDQTGYTKTRLTAAFRSQIGLSPKRYGRVLRFRRALTLLAEGHSLARVTHRAGYYDQPHLNAEFRELARMAPTEFLDGTRYQGSVNLAES